MSVAAGSGGGGDGGSGPSVNRVGPGPSWASSSSTSSSSMSAAPRKVQPASAASGAPTMQPAAASRLRLFLSTRRQQDCHICRDGGQVVLDQISGDQLCRNCGLILESKILSEEQEWRNFSGDSGVGSGDRSRVGEAVDTWLQDGIGGTTMLGGSKRLLQLNESTTSVGTNDRLLKSAFANLRLVAEALNLRDNVIETAKDIAKDLLDTGALKSRNTLLNMLAVVYLACREAGVHRSLKEMTVYDQCLTERELGKAVNTVKKLLPSRLGISSAADTAAKMSLRFCSRLQLSIQLADMAEYIAGRASKMIVAAHRPNSLAAAAILLVVQLSSRSEMADKLPRASDISAVTGASANTIYSVFRDLLSVAEHLLPEEVQASSTTMLQELRKNVNSRGKRKFQTESAGSGTKAAKQEVKTAETNTNDE
eukprot:GHVT01009572.1.p1 GENE.GHVT01009572.1~~GHVT01009572.1.p1  ORF type:complete len:424 (+),score=70.54 GHVT01009572.1:632-1903(+)